MGQSDYRETPFALEVPQRGEFTTGFPLAVGPNFYLLPQGVGKVPAIYAAIEMTFGQRFEAQFTLLSLLISCVLSL